MRETCQKCEDYAVPSPPQQWIARPFHCLNGIHSRVIVCRMLSMITRISDYLVVTRPPKHRCGTFGLFVWWQRLTCVTIFLCRIRDVPGACHTLIFHFPQFLTGSGLDAILLCKQKRSYALQNRVTEAGDSKN